MPIDLYMNMVSGPSRSVYITAQLLGVDVNVKTIDLMAGETRTEQFLKINPTHTIPALDDNGFTLFDSHAIMTYLVNQYRPDSELYPKDPKKRATVDKLLYFDSSALFSALIDVLRPKFHLNQEPTPEAMETLKDRVSILEKLLGEKQYFCGDSLTLADLSLDTALFMLADEKIVSLPDNLKAWYQRMSKTVPKLASANQEASKIVAEFLAKNKKD